MNGANCSIRSLGPHDLNFAFALSSAVAPQWRYHSMPVTPDRVATDLLGEADLAMVVTDVDGSPAGLAVFDGWSAQDQTVNLSLVISPHARRRRLTMEAFLLCLRIAFTTLPLRRVLMQSNALAFSSFASVLRRGYMRELGLIPQQYYFDGDTHDLRLLAVDRPDWAAMEEEVGPRLRRSGVPPIYGEDAGPGPEDLTILRLPAEVDASLIHSRLTLGPRSSRWSPSGPWPRYGYVADELTRGRLPFQALALAGANPLALAAIGELDPVDLRAVLYLDVIGASPHQGRAVHELLIRTAADVRRSFPIRTLELRIPASWKDIVETAVQAGFDVIGTTEAARFVEGAWTDETLLVLSGGA